LDFFVFQIKFNNLHNSLTSFKIQKQIRIIQKTTNLSLFNISTVIRSDLVNVLIIVCFKPKCPSSDGAINRRYVVGGQPLPGRKFDRLNVTEYCCRKLFGIN
uniref:Uncharacterized protein n=1 Tax=Schistosoma curassoni TaxID=6186 RepID=A0A183JIQ6_9TREM